FQQLDTFFEAIIKIKMLDKITASLFRQILTKLGSRILPIVSTLDPIKSLYKKQIANEFLRDPMNVEIILNSIIDSNKKEQRININNFLDKDQRDELFQQYIDSPKAKQSYIHLIAIERFKPDVDISTKYNASKREAQIITRSIKNDPFTFTTTVESSIVSMDRIVEENISNDNKDSRLLLQFNEKWLNKFVDYSTILQNLIYVFGIVDNNLKFTGISKNESGGFFERFLTLWGKNEYHNGEAFKNSEMVLTSKMQLYIKFLRQRGIKFESVIKWYFDTYLPKYLGIKGFYFGRFNFEDSLRSRIMMLCVNFQRILKEYQLYSESGEINSEIVDQMKVPHLNELKSLCDKKYVISGEKMQSAMQQIFSDQSSFGHISNGLSFQNELLKGVPVSCFKNFNVKELNWLTRNGFLTILKGKVYIFSEDYLVMRDLFYNDEINYFWKDSDTRECIDSKVKLGQLSFRNNLFTRKESDYIDYYYGSRFSNGLGIRNKYLHGSAENISKSQDEQNYCVLIYLFCLLIIKINEEFDHSQTLNENSLIII
ncbi:hypothetical protein, partial [Lentilactobacillus diolivorans]